MIRMKKWSVASIRLGGLSLCIGLATILCGAQEMSSARIEQTSIDTSGAAATLTPYEQELAQATIDAEKETLAEFAKNIIWKTAHKDGAFFRESPDDHIEDMLSQPRVNKLLSIAGRSEADRQEVIKEVVRMCHTYLELPLLPRPVIPYQPDRISVGGGSAYPFILAKLDFEAKTLPLVVEMYDHRIEGSRLKHAEEHGMPIEDAPPASQFRGGEFGNMLSFAAATLLRRISSDDALLSACNPDQKKQAKACKEYLDSLGNSWSAYTWKEYEIMEFARNFVDSAGPE